MCQRYCRFCAPARHFFTAPPLVSPKFPHVPLWVDGWSSGYEEWRLIIHAISFQDCQPMWSWSTYVTGRWRDGRTTCNLNTALCTIVHRAVMSRLWSVRYVDWKDMLIGWSCVCWRVWKLDSRHMHKEDSMKLCQGNIKSLAYLTRMLG